MATEPKKGIVGLGFMKNIEHLFRNFNLIWQEQLTVNQTVLDKNVDEQIRNKKKDELARALDNAINYAVAIAQRNYKFIVSQYRPQDNKIQLLLPIYLSGSFTEKPDFALILDPDPVNQIYLPQTILPFDAACQNARLIAKPDEYWLNPDKI